jgi:predicted RND superfamily exporter protein
LPFLGNTRYSFKSPPGSLAARTATEIAHRFPAVTEELSIGSYPVVVLVSSTQRVTHLPVAPLVESLSLEILEEAARHVVVATATGLFMNSSAPWLANEHISRDQLSTIITILVARCPTRDAYPLFDAIQRIVDGFNLRTSQLGPLEVSATITGEIVMLRDAQSATIKEFEVADIFCLPIALVILWYTVGWSALIVLLTLPISAGGCFLFLLPMSRHVDVPSFGPSIFISLLVATSLDYSLFLLSRYKEEMTAEFRERADSSSGGGKEVEEEVEEEVEQGPMVDEGASEGPLPPDATEEESKEEGGEESSEELERQHEYAVAQMAKHAGHTVALSGLTLAVCFGAVSLLPVDTLSSVGAGGAIVLITTVVCHVTLTPALFLVAGGRCCRRCHPRRARTQPTRRGTR